jgi:hypothetical protein
LPGGGDAVVGEHGSDHAVGLAKLALQQSGGAKKQ